MSHVGRDLYERMLTCNLSTRLNENSVEREERGREEEEGNEREVVVGKGREIKINVGEK